MSYPRKIIHSRGVSYEFTYRVRGRMVRKRYPTRSAALDAMADARTQIRMGTHLAPIEAKGTTVATYGQRWVSGLQVAQSTRANYEHCLRRHILPKLGDIPISSLRRSDVVVWVTMLSASGLAASTIDNVYTVLAMVMRSATYDRLIPASPCFKIKLPPRPTRQLAVFDPDQIRVLLQAVRPQHYAALATAVGTGLRQAELLGLRLPRINLLRRELAVEGQCLTPAAGGMPHLTDNLKTPASRRVVPLPRFVVEALGSHIDRYPTGPGESLFTNPRNGLWRRGAFNDSVWKPTLVRAGLPIGYGLHALRHTYASSLISEGLHPKVIQARLGHKSIVETMDTYGHLFPDQNEETADALDRRFGAVDQPGRNDDMPDALP
jgi:integrase